MTFYAHTLSNLLELTFFTHVANIYPHFYVAIMRP